MMNIKRNSSALLAISVPLALSACAPAGPAALGSEFRKSAAEQDVAVIPLLSPLGFVAPDDDDASQTAPIEGGRRSDLLTPGDVLSLSIIETPASTISPMLLSAPLVVNVEVGEDGRVNVPFAGSLVAAGGTPDSLRGEIVSRLSAKMYQPQVVVTRSARPRNVVSVFGSVSRGGSLPLGSGEHTLGEIVATASPQLVDPRNGRVILSRDGTTQTFNLFALYNNPGMDVPVYSGDVVSVVEDAAYVSVIGATQVPGRIPISGPDFSMIDAIATVRGLSPEFADPRAVFLVREVDGLVTIHELDMRNPLSINAAAKTPMRGGDVIVAARSSFAQTRLILGLAIQSLGASANVTRAVN